MKNLEWDHPPIHAGGKPIIHKQQLMQTQPKKLTFLLVGTLLAVGGYVLWKSPGNRAGTAREHKVAGYQDSMHPWIKSDQPGKCTICGMDLTAIQEGDQGFAMKAGTVALNSNSITVLHLQTEEVKRRILTRTLRVAGTLEPNETRKTIVSAPARGRIDALTVDYAGVEVVQGQKLITMFSPELVQLRKTLLAVRQADQPGGSNNITPSSISSGIYTGDILAPQAGVVLERNVYLGQYAAEGDRLLTLVDASVLWFRFDVYEKQLPYFEVGQKLDVTIQAVPGVVFPAVISFIEPALNDRTRAVKVRADILNPVVSTAGPPRRALRFGMSAEGRVRVTVEDVLAIPRSAVLMPGSAGYAYIDEGGGAYQRRRVKLGRQGDHYWEVLKGVEEGESVVTSGNVLIDSQAQFNLASQQEREGTEEIAMEEPAIVQESIAAEAPPLVVPGNESDDKGNGSPPAADTVPPTLNLANSTRSERMSALMSPGMELQNIRREAILAELQLNDSNAVPSAPPHDDKPPAATPGNETHAMPADPAGQGAAPGQGLSPASDTHPQREVATPGTDTVAKTEGARMAAIAESNNQKAAVPYVLTTRQRQALVALIETGDGFSQALAADDLVKYNSVLKAEPNALLALPNEFGSDHQWSKLIERLATAGKAQKAKDLAEARKQFLPFSTAMVELIRQLPKDDPDFAKLKIYHCPMAPKPGLWMQAKGPLRNPFYGAEMLTCGEEVVK